MNIFLKLRKESGLKQNAVAEKLNVKHNTVSNWERGISLPDYPTLVKIADLYEVSVDYLLGREDELGIINIKESNFEKNPTNGFITRLKELINEKCDGSQKKLSMATEIPASTINCWITKGINPTYLQIIKLAKFFECSSDYLLELEDELGIKPDYVGISPKTGPLSERTPTLDGVELLADEEELIRDFRKLNFYQQGAIKIQIKALAEQGEKVK